MDFNDARAFLALPTKPYMFSATTGEIAFIGTIKPKHFSKRLK